MNGALNGTANEIEPISFAVVFNWEYISTEQSVTETAQQLQEMGLTK